MTLGMTETGTPMLHCDAVCNRSISCANVDDLLVQADELRWFHSDDIDFCDGHSNCADFDNVTLSNDEIADLRATALASGDDELAATLLEELNARGASEVWLGERVDPATTTAKRRRRSSSS